MSAAVASVPADAAARRDAANRLPLRQVVSQVLTAAAAGALPRLAWHAGLAPDAIAELRARWPLSCAAWDAIGGAGGGTGKAADGDPVAPAPIAGAAELLLPLRDALLAQRADAASELTVLANALAAACFGPRHLWQDLGLASRAEVSALLGFGFPGVVQSNHRRLRWKRHLFLALGERIGRPDLPPPRCDGCDEFDACFGAPATVATLRGPMQPTTTRTP